MKDWLKKYFTLSLVGYLILAGGVAYTVGRVHSISQQGIAKNERKLSKQQQQVAAQQRQLATQENRIHNQLISTCIRINQVRASDNGSHYADYISMKQQIGFSNESLRSNYLALKKLNISKPVLDRALRQSEESLRTEKKALKLKSWTPLTDCTLVIAIKGAEYPSPPPVYFYQQRPLKPDFNFRNASKAAPVDSVYR